MGNFFSSANITLNNPNNQPVTVTIARDVDSSEYGQFPDVGNNIRVTVYPHTRKTVNIWSHDLMVRLTGTGWDGVSRTVLVGRGKVFELDAINYAPPPVVPAVMFSGGP